MREGETETGGGRDRWTERRKAERRGKVDTVAERRTGEDRGQKRGQMTAEG